MQANSEGAAPSNFAAKRPACYRAAGYLASSIFFKLSKPL